MDYYSVVILITWNGLLQSFDGSKNVHKHSGRYIQLKIGNNESSKGV